MEIAVPDSGIIGLHADNLEIEGVLVDGEPAEFDFFPHYQPVEIENRWCSVSSASSAADAAGATYISALERELIPNLLIMCFKTMNSVGEQQDQLNPENGEQSSGETKQVTHITNKFMFVLFLECSLCIGLSYLAVAVWFALDCLFEWSYLATISPFYVGGTELGFTYLLIYTVENTCSCSFSLLSFGM